MNNRDSSGTRTSSLSGAKQRLIEQRLGRFPSQQAPPSTISRRPVGQPIPLSPAQHGLWLIHRVDPTSAAYNLNSAYRVEGELDLAALETSLNRLAHRHEILTTTFETDPSGVVQILHPETRLNVEHVSCSDDDVVVRARELARRPFDLETGPLMRLTLIEGDEQHRLLLLTSHHIILDEWSLKLFWREFAVYYQATVAGKNPGLEALPLQFADYAHWQKQRLENGLADQQIAFWRRRLAEPLPSADLPTDRARSVKGSDHGGYRSQVIPTETVRQLRSLASDESASLSMVLLLGMKLLIQRYCDSSDILVGTPVADRQLPETTGLLGYFLNATVLRTDLGGNPTVREALGRVRQTLLEVFEHRDVPFDQLVRELSPTRPTTVHPYFQTMFVYQRQEDAPAPLKLAGVQLRPLSIDSASAKFDLTLFVQERDDGLETKVEFRDELFDKPTIDRMLGHYGVLLQAITESPDAPIAELAMLTPQEQRDVMQTWQGRELPLAQDALVHEVIAARFADHSDAVAVLSSSGQTITYGELQRSATTVARELRSAGVESGETIALQLDRSPAAIAGILGIIQAGAAYLPVDPDYPTERRQFMLQDAGVRLAVTDSDGSADLESMGIRCIGIRLSQEEPSPDSPPEVAIASDDPAYVIYTSGSTGLPKGVVVSHGNLRASNSARLDYYKATPERYLLIPSFSFDSSVAGIFWTLSAGGTLVLPSEVEVRAPDALIRTIEAHQITHLLCVPTLYRRLLEAASPTTLNSLQSVIVAGEACPPELVAAHRESLPEVPLFNEYGPTEATVWSTAHQCGVEDTRGSVPIGRPVANTQVYVLDRLRRPVPSLIPGQIYIGGWGVAQGYLGREELTSERFITTELPGRDTPVQIYATGDRGKWRPDGTLEFLGRDDEQVKLSGFRIELGEVEGALRSHPAVADAAVAAVSDDSTGTGQRRLAAWCVLKDPPSTPLLLTELRRHLAGKLPSYMLPTSFFELTELPMQPNGKLDRRALTELRSPNPTESGSEPSGNRFEIQLMRIWLELLDDPSIGLQSNFFEHGGHSLLIPGLIERVRQDFAVELPLGAIFEAPTVAELAAVIAADDGRKSWSSLVSIRSGGTRPPIYVIHGLAGEISYFYNLARYLPRDRPIFGVQAPAQPFDQMVPMAQSYLQEIRQVQPEGPYLLVGYCLGGCIAYEMARQLREIGEPVDLLALINSVPPRHLLKEFAPLATILARRLKRFTSKGPRQMLASLTSGEGVRQHLQSGVRGDKASSDETLDDLLERMHPAYQEATTCHYRALSDYYPKPYPGDAWLFRGTDLYLGADFAWRQVIQGRLEVESISGHHQYVLKEPNVQGTAEKLSRILDGLDR